MFERFTDQSRRVVVLAQEEARLMMHEWIGTEHILLGLVHEDEGLAGRVLESFGVTVDGARRQIEERVGLGGTMPVGHIAFTPRAKKVLELALREALQLGHNYIGTEHILLGLICEGEGVGAEVLRDATGELTSLRQTVVDRVVAEAPAPLEFRCARCREPIIEPAALLFGPPNPASHVRKDHICLSCYIDITSTFER